MYPKFASIIYILDLTVCDRPPSTSMFSISDQVKHGRHGHLYDQLYTHHTEHAGTV